MLLRSPASLPQFQSRFIRIQFLHNHSWDMAAISIGAICILLSYSLLAMKCLQTCVICLQGYQNKLRAGLWSCRFWLSIRILLANWINPPNLLFYKFKWRHITAMMQHCWHLKALPWDVSVFPCDEIHRQRIQLFSCRNGTASVPKCVISLQCDFGRFNESIKSWDLVQFTGWRETRIGHGCL